MLVTTTNTLEGIQIKRYLKPVSAHIVAGTGFLSDFGASFSDVFGGRSGTYQRQLQSLYDDAIAKLKQNAAQAGGNCILGLNIDIDEISGKGKAMFMVTATGTAAIIEPLKLEAREVTGSITSNYYDTTYSLIIELNKLEKDSNYFAPVEKLYPLLDAGLPDAIDLLISSLKVSIFQGIALNDEFKSKAVSFLRRISFDHACNSMYDALICAEKVEHINLLKWFIETAGLVDMDRVVEMLNSNDIDKRKTALKIATLKKESFTKDDALFYQQLIDSIPHKFNELGSTSIKKGGMLSKEKEVWNCRCGREDISDKYCSKCGKDIYGFKSFDLKQDQAISILNDRVEVLNFIFK